MPRLQWGARAPYEDGIDQAVLYLGGSPFVWNGLIGVEAGDAAVVNQIHYDGFTVSQESGYADHIFRATAYTYPPEFDAYVGQVGYYDHQFSKRFDFCYRSQTDDGYELHLVYNALAVDNTPTNETRSGDVSAAIFGFDVYPTPISVANVRRTGELVVRYPLSSADAVRVLEDRLYGTASTTASMPTPTQVIDIFAQYPILAITDSGVGTWTATGPDTAIKMVDSTTYTIDSQGITYLDVDTYKIRSY